MLAFLLMGLQARTIAGGMPAERLHEAAWFALAVIVCLVLVRMAWVLAYVRLASRYHARRRCRSAADEARGGADRLVRYARPGDARDRLRAAR